MTDMVNELAEDLTKLTGTVNALAAGLADCIDELAASRLDCVVCAAERHAAYESGAQDNNLPPIRPARVVAGGNSVCYDHIQFGPAPVAPGRTASGIVLPGQGM